MLFEQPRLFGWGFVAKRPGLGELARLLHYRARDTTMR